MVIVLPDPPSSPAAAGYAGQARLSLGMTVRGWRPDKIVRLEIEVPQQVKIFTV
jgi:hypothetical protein